MFLTFVRRREEGEEAVAYWVVLLRAADSFGIGRMM